MSQGFLNGKGRIAGPLGMILMGHRCAEKGHDPIAGELINGAFILVDFIYQNFETPIHDLVNFFGVQFFRDGGIVGHVCKKDCHQLALAFDGAAGG